jgi:peptidoglycan DL-endopeptidase LytF
MSRRNTIIIAVLVNAGLLLVLFTTAIGQNDKKKEKSKEISAVSKMQEGGGGEVTTEQLLNEYIASTQPIQNEILANAGDEINVSAMGTTALPSQEIPSSETPVSSLPTTVPVASPVTQVQPSPISTASQIAENIEVIVKKGDALERIARANRTTVAAIMKANNLSSTNLKIGQVLKIPRGKDKEEKPAQSVQITGDYYVVKEGDNPTLIASKCSVKLEELLRLNNIDAQKAKRLKPGDKLRIR